MDRRRIIFAVAVLAICAFAAHAQPAAGIHRVGFLSPISGNPEPPTLRAFREGMRQLGYVEGENLVLETRFGEGKQERLPGAAAELLRLKVEVLLVGSEVGVLAAKQATSTVPIVFAGVSNPVPRLVPSLAHPGGNITGVTFGVGGTGFGEKWVQLLKEAVPAISRIAVLSNSADPQTAVLLPDIQKAAQALSIKLELFDAKNEAELNKALGAIGSSVAQGMIVTNTPLFAERRVQLAQFATQKRLPAIYFFKPFADAGGLMSYGGSLQESYRRAATYVDKILKGAKPGDLPIEQPTRIELVVNKKAAKAIGLALPQALLLRADEVIE